MQGLQRNRIAAYKRIGKFGIFILLLMFTNVLVAQNAATVTAIATFATGCFWCTQADFDKVPGVIKTTTGYTGGEVLNPTYQQVSQGGTGHFESLEVIYDPAKTNYQKLLDVFWHTVDPFNEQGQFCDKGDQYRAAIFYHSEEQKTLAEASKLKIAQMKRFPRIAVLILPAKTFYPAEDYHQKYYLKNPLRYNFYRYTCGRDQRLQEVWGKTE